MDFEKGLIIIVFLLKCVTIYSKDFFYLNHWEKLPKTWQESLPLLSTLEMSALLDRYPVKTRHVLPLSLLSFTACTQTFSADRRCHENFEDTFDDLFNRKDQGRGQRSPESASELFCCGAEDDVNLIKVMNREALLDPCKTDLDQKSTTRDMINTKSQSNVPYRSHDISEKPFKQKQQNSKQCAGTHMQSGADNLTFIPTGDDGKLHYFFKKHVKPKKQHEILNLGKVIKLLSDKIECSNVVDVGAGLGHLSRLLSFGYGLHVTSVEAAGTHAPKASKYDREIDREIKKKKIQAMQIGDSTPSNELPSSLPCHVTSMIYSNMTAEDFLAIVKSQQHIQDDITNVTVEGDNHIKSDNAGKVSETVEQDIEVDETTGSEIKMDAHAIHKTENNIEMEANPNPKEHLTEKRTSNVFETAKRHNEMGSLCEVEAKVAKSKDISKTEHNVEFLKTSLCTGQEKTNQNTTICDKRKLDEMKRGSADTAECSILKSGKSDLLLKDNNYPTVAEIVGSRDQSHNMNAAENKEVSANTFDKLDDDRNAPLDEKPVTVDGMVDNLDNGSPPWSFILTGLHACGDLTPTFLRFFVNCSAAKGLASVGCCYMKISDESCGEDTVGYPMSQCVAGLPHHRLSFNTRELACHFADTYSQRLKDCSIHLKIHSYRAALEWLAKTVCPHFQRSSVQIPSKKTDKMDFESYAHIGIKKFGLSTDLLTPELLNVSVGMTSRWKDVVALYTLRLALAPVVETLILVDRMFFLYEHGYSSALLPIFDPSISPRNFVLLSWKENNIN